MFIFVSELLEHGRNPFCYYFFSYSILSKLGIIDETILVNRSFFENEQFHSRNDCENLIVLYITFLLSSVLFDIQ